MLPGLSTLLQLAHPCVPEAPGQLLLCPAPHPGCFHPSQEELDEPTKAWGLHFLLPRRWEGQLLFPQQRQLGWMEMWVAL